MGGKTCECGASGGSSTCAAARLARVTGGQGLAFQAVAHLCCCDGGRERAQQAQAQRRGVQRVPGLIAAAHAAGRGGGGEQHRSCQPRGIGSPAGWGPRHTARSCARQPACSAALQRGPSRQHLDTWQAGWAVRGRPPQQRLVHAHHGLIRPPARAGLRGGHAGRGSRNHRQAPQLALQARAAGASGPAAGTK